MICITYALLCLPDIVFMMLHTGVHIHQDAPSVAGVGIKVDFQVALREFGNYGYILQTIISPLALLSVGSRYREVAAAMFCRSGHGQRSSSRSTAMELSSGNPSSPRYHGPSEIEGKPMKHTFRYPDSIELKTKYSGI